MSIAEAMSCPVVSTPRVGEGSPGSAVAVRAEAKIVVAGISEGDVALARYLADDGNPPPPKLRL